MTMIVEKKSRRSTFFVGWPLQRLKQEAKNFVFVLSVENWATKNYKAECFTWYTITLKNVEVNISEHRAFSFFNYLQSHQNPFSLCSEMATANFRN